ncbi:hypothetical protein ALP59_02233 [Pseudomonas savastanoi]|uniref:Uncharacterized protein n=1 Tax=Pseudomonas savastanoi TaxID=29438 RepID=A0A3M5FLU4_PSESS|nr:hypothetical protein ALP59_02233 [Pseudomonas savastanoi]
MCLLPKKARLPIFCIALHFMSQLMICRFLTFESPTNQIPILLKR